MILVGLSHKATFIANKDPKELIKQFVAELEHRQTLIVDTVEVIYPKPDDFDMLPVQKDWNRWVNQVLAIYYMAMSAL